MFYFCQNVECVKVSLGYKSNRKKIIVNFIHKEISQVLFNLFDESLYKTCHKRTFRRAKRCFSHLFPSELLICNVYKKMVAFITQIRQRKYLCLGKLCFLNKCTLLKEKMFFCFFFKKNGERQLHWAPSKGIRGNIRKI